MLVSPIADKALYGSDGDGLIIIAAVALGLAGVMADTSTDGEKGISPVMKRRRLGEFSL